MLVQYKNNPSNIFCNLLDEFSPLFSEEKLAERCSSLNKLYNTSTEDEKSYTISANLPGVGIENICVKVDNNQLIVTANQEKEDSENHLRKISYRKIYDMPFDVAENGIKASLKHGVLNLRLEKEKITKPVEVKINAL